MEWQAMFPPKKEKKKRGSIQLFNFSSLKDSEDVSSKSLVQLMQIWRFYSSLKTWTPTEFKQEKIRNLEQKLLAYRVTQQSFLENFDTLNWGVRL